MNNQSKQDKWLDESGTPVPVNRISKSEKLRERYAFSLAKEANKLNGLLSDFKLTISKACDDITEAVRAEHKMANKVTKDGKGNLTWFNFDRSIKVECRVHDQIAFDETLMQMCKEKLDEFLNRSLTGTDNALMVQELVKDAFSTTRGKLDAKKVMSLLKHEHKIESILYKDAMNFLRQSIRKPSSATYYVVSVRNLAGEYEVINLNISSI